MPKVSVLTPLYNTNPQYLRECIDSILNQTFTDFEFLILNDSPDNKEIEKIVKSYKDKRIKYYKNEKNIGISASRNKLLDLAKGEYIAIFDHDDISLPERLSQEVEYLDSHLDIGVVSSNLQYFPSNSITKHPTENLEIKKYLMFGMVVAHTAMMVRKSILDKYNIRYEEAFSPAEDYMFVLRLVKYTMFHNIQHALVKYRFLDTNTTKKQWDKMCNADSLCRDYALTQYPYLYSVALAQRPVAPIQYWVYIFDLIPVIRVKKRPHKDRWCLFGIIPVFAVRR